MSTLIPYLPTHSKNPVSLDHLALGDEFIRFLGAAHPLDSMPGREAGDSFWPSDTKKFGKEPYVVYEVVRGARGEKTGLGRMFAKRMM